jgi:hypothetical protein
MKHILEISNYKSDLFSVHYKENYFDDFILYNREDVIKDSEVPRIGHEEYLSNLVDLILKDITEYMILNNKKDIIAEVQLFNIRYNNWDTLSKQRYDLISRNCYAKNHYVTIKFK